ncbi:B12-binding domain-containing radical SAM protein [Candidatus Margulisiibacteriota bacterium]
MPKILLINPPIYDFCAYDFWLKPYGLLKIGGFLREKAELELFDFLDRCHDFSKKHNLRSDNYNRGKYFAQKTERPEVFRDIPRNYQRFGLPKIIFQEWFEKQQDFDFVLLNSGMTYWYPGVKEVINEVRQLKPGAKIILGGIYATIFPEHAENLGADLVVEGNNLKKLEDFLGLKLDQEQVPLWDAYPELTSGVLKLTQGCPFNCTYCASKKMCNEFNIYSLHQVLKEYDLLIAQGAKDIAFYDDALLFKPEKILLPFLTELKKRKSQINLHTPNALHVRYLTESLAEEMISAGVKTFYLGIENIDYSWQKETGIKLQVEDITKAAQILKSHGVEKKNITAYILLGHPKSKIKDIEKTMEFINNLGIKILLSEFSPVPGTEDGDLCIKEQDTADPLMHNKTAYTVRKYGFEEVNRLKALCKKFNNA